MENPDLFGSYQNTKLPLHNAILKNKDENIINDLINPDSISMVNDYNESALLITLMYNPDISENIIKLLINEDNVNQISKFKNTPLIAAIKNKYSSELIKLLITNVNMHYTDYNKNTTLMCYINHTMMDNIDYSVFDKLLHQDNINALNKEGNNVLMLGIKLNVKSEYLMKLICANTINTINKDGDNALMIALNSNCYKAKRRNNEIVVINRDLYSIGTFVITDCEFATDNVIINNLITNESIHQINKDGNNALMKALMDRTINYTIFEKLSTNETIRQVNKDGNNALMISLINNTFEGYMTQKSATDETINQFNKDGNNALMLAIINKRCINNAHLLINAKNALHKISDNDNMLHLAIKYNTNYYVIYELIKYGLQYQLNDKNECPLIISVKQKSPNGIINTLIDHKTLSLSIINHDILDIAIKNKIPREVIINLITPETLKKSISDPNTNPVVNALKKQYIHYVMKALITPETIQHSVENNHNVLATAFECFARKCIIKLLITPETILEINDENETALFSAIRAKKQGNGIMTLLITKETITIKNKYNITAFSEAKYLGYNQNLLDKLKPKDV